MTRSEPMRTLPLAEFLRLYNDSAYHGWSGYDANDYPPCDADDVQVCFAPDNLPHDRLGRWSSYSLRGKPVSPETAVRLIRILDESVRKELCFPDVDLLAPSPNSGYDHAHGWAHPDGYVGLDMGCGFWLASAANRVCFSPIILEKYSCVSVSLQPSRTLNLKLPSIAFRSSLP